MWKQRWWFALPLAFAVTIGSAHASTIRDRAGMFDPNAVREAEAKLNQIERDTRVSTTIETIDSLQGQPLDSVALEHAERSRTEGIFILIPKKERKIEVLASRAYARAFPHERRLAIRDALVAQFKGGDFNAGLRDGVQTIEREVAVARNELGGQLRRAEAPRAAPFPRQPAARPRGQQGFGLGSLLGIGLVILAVLVGIRLLGSLFGGGQGSYGPGMGRPGMGPGPGYGPGYGGGYGGGRGGGFLSSLFGGIGGAMAGNWLYDQFSGRHSSGGTYADNTAYTPGSESAPTGDAGGGSDWVGGGSEAGDWGGGGGDWGGGGGDWGGGGGGDWGGGGGGDGGSW
jgi:uncharacterized protein